MKTEYWCERRRHWAKEVRFDAATESTPRCETCCALDYGDWDLRFPIVREVKEPRYVAERVITSYQWQVMDMNFPKPVDLHLTEVHAKEMTALRNKWWEGE